MTSRPHCIKPTTTSIFIARFVLRAARVMSLSFNHNFAQEKEEYLLNLVRESRGCFNINCRSRSASKRCSQCQAATYCSRGKIVHLNIWFFSLSYLANHCPYDFFIKNARKPTGRGAPMGRGTRRAASNIY